MALDEPKEGEKTVAINSVEVLVNSDAKPYIASKVLDYVTSRSGTGFVLTGC